MNDHFASGEITEMTKDEWFTEGKRLFGENWDDWRFVCPVCKHVAAIKDFRQYKDQGAGANSATCECIGRYTGAKDSVNGSQPCDYAGYGLFRLSPVRVLDDGKTVHSFAFASEEAKGKDHV